MVDLLSISKPLKGVFMKNRLYLHIFFLAVIFLTTDCISPQLAAAVEIPVPTRRPVSTTPDSRSSTEAETKGNKGAMPEISSNLPNKTGEMTTILDAAEIACRTQLLTLGARFEAIPQIAGKEGCGIESPLLLKEVAPGVKLEPQAEINCKTALATVNWVGQVVLPALRTGFPERRLVSIRQASTYVCRPRNNVEGSKLSEHATGNAIDIAAFNFQKEKPIIIAPRQRTGQMEEAFQKAVRFGACPHFTTVLGPYSDASHAEHLHFDMAERRGGYRLCDLPTLPNDKDSKKDSAIGKTSAE